MQILQNVEYGGERPLFALRSAELDHVVIHPGESALKHVENITARECLFEGKYPFWHDKHVVLEGGRFSPGARAAIWYADDVRMKHTRIDAPKMFRDMENIDLEQVELSDAMETLWNCRNIKLRHVSADHADYLFMHSANIDIADYVHHGNYAFQYCRNVVIRDAEIHAKDAFWNSEDVTVYDSEIDGEFLGWHTKRLKLVNCRIKGTQPLCYAEDLVLENCTMDPDCDLGFEYSTVNADIRSPVTSIKNPIHGLIRCESLGKLILDEHRRSGSDCIIETGTAQ